MKIVDYTLEERPNPIQEQIGEGMFTDREEEMTYLRVGTIYIALMPVQGAAELALKWAQQFNMAMSLELAYTVAHLTTCHPYYIWCLFSSRKFTGVFNCEEAIQAVLTFEIANHQGWINQFWREHDNAIFMVFYTQPKLDW